jgi:sulfur transfer complex TusBCD TusB component (DsrH family)
MGSDGLVELDQECWVALAKYNLFLATGFGILALVSRTALSGNELLLIENGVLALLFGTVQTYAWLSA